VILSDDLIFQGHVIDDLELHEPEHDDGEPGCEKKEKSDCSVPHFLLIKTFHCLFVS